MKTASFAVVLLSTLVVSAAHGIVVRHDIALMKLARPVQRVAPLEMEVPGNDTLAEGTVVLLAGRGDRGDGLSGIDGNDGFLRVAENAVSRLEPLRLEVRFDAPEDGALPAEGISGPGDSGTPALVERDGRLRVVGIGSVGRSPDGQRYGHYGSLDLFIRVAPYRDWIAEVLLH